MSGRTHAVVGANAAWIAPLLGGSTNIPLILFALIGAVAALLPDIEAGRAKIQYVAGGVFGIFRNIFQHRGFTHSLLGVLLLFLLSLSTFSLHPVLPLIITLGYITHPVIDGFNHAGTQYLYPVQRKFWLVPKILRTPLGGLADQLLFVLGLLGVALLVLSSFDVSGLSPPLV